MQLNLEERFLQYFQQTKNRGMSGHECENWENHKQGTQWHFAHRICRPSVGANTTTTHIITAFMKWSAKWMTDGRTDGWIVGSPLQVPLLGFFSLFIFQVWNPLRDPYHSINSMTPITMFFAMNKCNCRVASGLCHSLLSLHLVLIPVFPFLCKICLGVYRYFVSFPLEMSAESQSNKVLEKLLSRESFVLPTWWRKSCHVH